MKAKLLIPGNFILPVANLGFIAIIEETIFKITHHFYLGISGSLLFEFGLLFSLIAWIVVLVDVLQNKIENSFLWFLGLIFFGNITSIVYLSKRKF